MDRKRECMKFCPMRASYQKDKHIGNHREGFRRNTCIHHVCIYIHRYPNIFVCPGQGNILLDSDSTEKSDCLHNPVDSLRFPRHSHRLESGIEPQCTLGDSYIFLLHWSDNTGRHSGTASAVVHSRYSWRLEHSLLYRLGVCIPDNIDIVPCQEYG